MNFTFQRDRISKTADISVSSETTTDLASGIRFYMATSSPENLVFTFKRLKTSETPDTSVATDVGTMLAVWPNSYTSVST